MTRRDDVTGSGVYSDCDCWLQSTAAPLETLRVHTYGVYCILGSAKKVVSPPNLLDNDFLLNGKCQRNALTRHVYDCIEISTPALPLSATPRIKFHRSLFGSKATSGDAHLVLYLS